MPDHFHLLLTPAPDVSLEKALQLLKGGFSFRVKRELGSRTEIWQEGSTEHRVKDFDDFAYHVNYIGQNPVRAGLAERAEAYPYSSAAGCLYLDPVPPWLKPLDEGRAVVTGLKSGASTGKTAGASISRTSSASTGKTPGASTSRTSGASTGKTPGASTSRTSGASTDRTECVDSKGSVAVTK